MLKTFIEMDRVYSSFPKLKGFVKEIKGEKLKRNKDGNAPMAQCANMTLNNISENCSIYFNKDFFSNISIAERVYNRSVSRFQFPQGANFAHTDVHELGHAITNKLNEYEYWKSGSSAKDIVRTVLNGFNREKLTREEIIKGIEAYAIIKKYDILIDNKDALMNYYNKSSKGIRDEMLLGSISGYASTSSSEAISEALTDIYANGDNANLISKKYLNN